ncbi:MAG TPA: response regulator [Polyangiales bacterium]|nr:response regulator [Polyangiales bacterium]
MSDSSPAPTILNVNDNEEPLYVVSVMLRSAGFHVVEARTGAEALAMVEQHQPDLLVLDIRLPDVSGLEVCKRLRAHPKTASIKILHTSATLVSTDNKVESLSLGADGYLNQPFKKEELIATVQSLLRLHQAEKELRTVAEQLREADRRKDEFLAMLAHELRNPLNAISTGLAIVGRRAPADVAEQRAREILERQTSHLTRLVDDLLDVARVTQGKIGLRRDPIDLCAVLESAMDHARDTKLDPRHQHLDCDVPDTPVLVNGDATRLEQVFTNLLDNASKYTPDGGRIQVSVKTRNGDSGPEAHIAIRDNGQGITSETLPKIFALFSQADVPIARSLGGLGVGLTMVQALVELHGGTVKATSPGRGQGSEFEVVLPALPQETRAATPSSPPEAEGTAQRRRVLLVEDNCDALEVLSDLLALWGHEVRAESDGLSAVDTALQMLPDIALIDIGLPGIDGYEVARRIRAHPKGRDLKLVALTGYGAPEQRAQAANAGFNLHLVKPVQPAGLAQLLRE